MRRDHALECYENRRRPPPPSIILRVLKHFDQFDIELLDFFDVIRSDILTAFFQKLNHLCVLEGKVRQGDVKVRHYRVVLALVISVNLILGEFAPLASLLQTGHRRQRLLLL